MDASSLVRLAYELVAKTYKKTPPRRGYMLGRLCVLSLYIQNFKNQPMFIKVCKYFTDFTLDNCKTTSTIITNN
jgi:hypothetical protein